MIHNNEVLEKTIETAAAFTEKNNDLELYIVQNVYGKIIVYADTLQKELVAHLERELTDKIDVWLKQKSRYGNRKALLSGIGYGYLKNILPMYIGMRKKERKQNVPYLASW